MGSAAAQCLAAKGARVALLGRRAAVVEEKAALLGGSAWPAILPTRAAYERGFPAGVQRDDFE